MKGVHAAIVTHFDADLTVDHDAVAAEVNRLVLEGVHGIVPNGTVGEGGSLSREERRAVIETVVGAAGGGSGVRGHLGADRRAGGHIREDAASAGADGAMILPPLLYRADERELVEFFGSVARATELPLMVYNNPLGSGSDLEPELLARLAREVPSITAFKETSGDARRIAELVNLCPDVDVLVGGDDWALEGLCAGAVGWVSGVADVLPAESVRLFELCVAGELASRAGAVRRAAAAGAPGHDAEARPVLQGRARRARDRRRPVPSAAAAADRERARRGPPRGRALLAGPALPS